MGFEKHIKIARLLGTFSAKRCFRFTKHPTRSCLSQAQASWTQHDFGHLSVFKSTRLNNILHHYTMCFTKVTRKFIQASKMFAVCELVSEMLLSLFWIEVSAWFQGAGSDWWKHLHYQHHAKPNVVSSALICLWDWRCLTRKVSTSLFRVFVCYFSWTKTQMSDLKPCSFSENICQKR